MVGQLVLQVQVQVLLLPSRLLAKRSQNLNLNQNQYQNLSVTLMVMVFLMTRMPSLMIRRSGRTVMATDMGTTVMRFQTSPLSG